MTSDPARPSTPSELRRLLDILDRASGHGANARELAEPIWLASHSGMPAHTAQPPADGPTPEAPATPSAGPEDPATGPEPPRAPSGRGFTLTHRPGGESPDEGPYRSLTAPLPPMLAHPLPLQRALRPLRRQVPSRLNTELDERSTARRIAGQGARPGTWLPVLRAKPERWLTLYLVYDAGPTMPVWRPLWRELHRVLGQTGAFRSIRLLAISPDGRLRQTPGGRPAALPPRDGRAVALVLSDCSGPHWYAGHEATAHWYRVLGRWARTMPVAVVQPLPERLWRRTALPGTAGLLASGGPAAANSALRFTPYDPLGEEHTGLPLPLLEPSGRWFGHWADMVAGAPGTEVPGVVARLGAGPSATVPEPGGIVAGALTPEERVLDFRAHASPEALRLAAHLAVGEPSLPVMRLVQAATEPRPEPRHLAEVVLSGLVTTAPGSPASSGDYVFRPGVRDVLSRALPRSTAARIDAVIQQHAAARPGEFPVAVSTGGTGEAGGQAGGEPLGVLTEETVRRLGGRPNAGPDEDDASTPADGSSDFVGGRYRLVERRHAGATSDLWRATDDRPDREVTLKLFHARVMDRDRRHSFLSDAERLAALGIRGLARVEDYGFHDDRPYVVTEPVDGEEWRPLLGPAVGPMSLDEIKAVGEQIITTLTKLHLNGVPHLDLGPATLVTREDGQVFVTDPGLGAYGLPDIGREGNRQWAEDPSGPLPGFRSPEQLFGSTGDERSDLYALGCLFHAMATGSAPALDSRAVRNAWVHGVKQPQPDLRSGLSAEFDQFVSDLLAIQPQDRPSGMQAMGRLRRTGGQDPDGQDPELSAVYDAVRTLDPNGNRLARVLRDTIDTLLDGPRTGRYDWEQLFKTEKVHLGTLMEIAIQREFAFPDGDWMDYRIAEVEVDCRYSQRVGSWMIPPEAENHICLLVCANDNVSRWSAGLLRVRREWLSSGMNRDAKFTIKAEHRDKITWLWHDAALPENTLLHMPAHDRHAVLGHRSGQRRVNELFRRVQHRRISRNTVATVAQQSDYMKRVRGNGGARSALRDEGIIILGDYRAHQEVARRLGLPVPQRGEFVSARVARADPGSGRPAAELDGALWSVALPDDPPVLAPELPYRS
ncbi:NaeI family type II restriction endonuclease [Streptomyces rubiginosohelvolus]|uniref:NaeI family type II restriction endonuclease n=1 Tax=Streptomyces rubiginosohelvolus TaxID=67362 RepID=UPI00367A1EC4